MPAEFGQVRIAAAILGGFLVGSCGGDDNTSQPTPLSPPPAAPAPVTLVRVDVDAPEAIELQRSAQLSATAVRSDGTSEDVTSQAQWRTSNLFIARISTSGEATALRAGEVTITAFFQNRMGSVVVSALPAGTYKLTGTVNEGGHHLDGVTVSVVSGTGTGLATATAGGGRFSLFGVAGHVTLQAKREGYLNKTIDVEVSRTTTHDFDLIPARTRGKLDGQYTLTLQANCEAESRPVPESARSRTYNATLAHDGLALTLKLSGTNILLTNGQGDTFEGSVDPNNNVVFDFGTFSYNYVFYGPVTATGLVERLSPTTELVVSGSVNAIATPTSIVGHLRGVFLERERAAFWETALCNSDHSFEMRRQ